MSKDDLFLHTTRLPKRVVDLIERLALESPWFYSADCAYGDSDHPLRKEMNPYFSYGMIKNDGKINRTEFRKYPWDWFDRAVNPEKYGFSSDKKIRAHITLHYPNPEKYGIPHNSHCDQEFPHLVALYYINDSDGDTFFFNGEEVIHREPIERGKLIVFSGYKKFHSSSSPSKNIRMTLNVNYESI